MEIHTLETAPPNSRDSLTSLINSFGWSPNVLGVFAGSPALIQGYHALAGILQSVSSFTESEREIIQLTNNFENDCEYCMAAHSTVVETKNLLSNEALDALRKGDPLDDQKQQALRLFTLAVLSSKGRVTESEKAAFIAAGYSDEQALEVILHIAFKVITNYANNMVDPPLDDAFEAQQWSKDEAQSCDPIG